MIVPLCELNGRRLTCSVACTGGDKKKEEISLNHQTSEGMTLTAENSPVIGIRSRNTEVGKLFPYTQFYYLHLRDTRLTFS